MPARLLLLLLVLSPSCRRAEAGGDPPDAAERPIPVAAATVEQRDLPVELEGLGTAIASHTIPVHTQVDGRLVEVAFQEGQEVRGGQLLALIDPQPFLAQLHQAQGALARDTALLEQSRLNYRRIVTLRAQHLVAQENVDDQQALVRQYEGAVLLDRGQVEAAQVNLRYTRVSAPIDGVVGVRLVDPGTIVHASDPNGLVVLTELDPIMVLVTLPQDDLPRVALALRKGPLPVELYSRDGSQRLAAGKVSALDNQINLTTGTLRLKALAPNRDRLIWPNQFVKAHVLVETRRNAIIAPSTAVERSPQGPIAFVIGPDERVAVRNVKVEMVVGELSIVSSGLRPGERVVIEGGSQLTGGAHVLVRSSPDGGAASGTE
jgi:multidrug efflux system membrane fusion protein